MRTKSAVLATLIAFTFLTAICSWSQATEQVLYSFTDGSDGGNPQGGVVLDRNGNLYGTTSSGGVYDAGTVFQVSPSNGGWAEPVLYNFTGGSDGGGPSGDLIIDTVGNIYGTTVGGGAHGQGAIFELQHVQVGWVESVVHSFDEFDGSEPWGLSIDSAGRGLGATRESTDSCGTVFTLQNSPKGIQFRTLYTFNSDAAGGCVPQGGVVEGAGRHLYGTTEEGGNGRGTVFQLEYAGSQWNETVIYNFEGGYDGSTPMAGLVGDSAGNLYGTTSLGGSDNSGTVFELTQTQQGWTKNIIYNFQTYPPLGLLSFDSSGNLYGATAGGAIYKLSQSNGAWVETTVLQLTGNGGSTPNGGLTFDPAGNIYGTTFYGGGVFNAGVVFKITP